MTAWPRILAVPLAGLALATAAHAAAVTLPFTLPRDSRVSLAVYDADGRLARTLLTGRPLAKGQHTVPWDGLDRYGRPLPAGDYTWKLVATGGLRAEFLTQVGQNVDPAWEKATGNHAAPSSVAVDATGLYRLGATNEGAHWGVKTDLAGRHLWTNDRWAADPWVQDTAAVTLVGDRLFELMPNGHVYGYDARTGRLFTGGDFDPKPWTLRWQAYQPPAGVKDDERRRLSAAQAPHDLAGDAANGLLVAAYPRHDALAWYSAKDGKLVDTAEGITKPAGIAVAPDGTVLVITGGQVVALSRRDKKPRVVIPADRLSYPWRLCVSPKSGDFFVAENSDLAGGRVTRPQPDPSGGKTPDLAAGPTVTGAPARRHHQVKRFAAAGRLLKAFGKPEGRGDGAYVPTDFRGLTDVEADPDGGFVVTEGGHTPPRRSARFAADGRLLREWYGAQHYGILACPEPGDPRFVWTLANAPQPGLVRWEVDYANKTWRVAEVYQDVFAANRHACVPSVPQVFEHQGRLYVQGGALQPSGLALVIYDPAAKRLRPCAASGKRGGRVYLWTDLNDDGLATDDEVQWLKHSRLGGWVDPGTLTLRTTPAPTDYNPGHRLTPTRLTPGGTPVYDPQAADKLAPWTENGKAHFPGDYRAAPDGSLYACFSDALSNPHETHENHGAWYYNSCSGIDRLVKWDRSGRPLWSVGRHSPDNDHDTGSTAMPRGFVGLTRDCVVWGDASDEETCRPTVWTADGLYVDELLRVPLGTLPKTLYGQDNANEYPSGHLHTDPKTGETFFYALNSGGGSPVYRITGWDGWHRQEGRLTLKEAATAVAKRDSTGLKAEYFNTPDCTGEPALTRTDKVVYFNWGKNSPDKAVTADTFSVRWSGSYEAATNEDTRFEVRGSFPWRDKGAPLWSRLWLGGRLVFDSRPRPGTGNTTFDAEERSSVGTVRVKLHAGQRIDLRLECGFKKGQAAVALSHDTPTLDRRAIPAEFLHPAPAGETQPVEVVRESRPPVLAHFDFEGQDGALEWSTAGGDVFGRLTGHARRVPGKVGQAIELTAKGEFDPALFPIDEELRLPDTDYTVEFWFKTTDANVRLCEAKRYSSYNNRWSDHVIALESGKLRFLLQGDRPLESPRPVNDGRWHHVVTTVGPGGQTLSLDGTLGGTGKLTRRTRTSNRLGLDLGPGAGPGTATIDELRILGEARHPAREGK